MGRVRWGGKVRLRLEFLIIRVRKEGVDGVGIVIRFKNVFVFLVIV